MIVYVSYLLILLFFCLFLRLEGHRIIGSEISHRYQRWRNLNSLVSTRHRTAWAIFYNSLRILCRVMYLSFIQYMNSSIVRLGRNRFLINYVVNGKLYTLVAMPVRGPSPILQVINDSSEDVTSQVLPYLGPSYDWHGTSVSFDSTFDSEQLTFNLSSGESVTCSTSTALNLKDKDKEK